jgi:hypothetical protein
MEKYGAHQKKGLRSSRRIQEKKKEVDIQIRRLLNDPKILNADAAVDVVYCCCPYWMN